MSQIDPRLMPPGGPWSPTHLVPAVWHADSNAQLVGPGIARFRNPEDTAIPAPPSACITADLRPLGAVPPDFPTHPRFAHYAGRHLIRIETQPGASFYGTGEVPGPLLRNGWRAVCWNTDAFEYSHATVSLYQSHPWILAVRPDGSAFGVLADTTWRAEIDLHDGITIAAEGIAPAVYIIERPSPQEVVLALADLTGRMPLPPKWALGYHQSRWSYEPDGEVRRIAAEFRRRRIPCDVLWLDIDYMDGFRCFTFDPNKFPDPKALNDDLHAQGFRTVWMIDPGIKTDPNYAVYRAGRDGDHFIKTVAGEEFHGDVWPGPCAFPDFTRRETREWWAGLYRDFVATGLDGVWNDMNEPAVLDQPRKAMPEDNIHRADPELGGPGTHARYHNIYGMQMVRATREGIARARPEKRPFVLTRSNFLGGQRYAATWTGDNTSDWFHLDWSIPMALNLGLSGQPFSGPDIGGFKENATPQLFARWMGIGALLPFSRGHSIKGSIDHEPWSFGPEVEHVCRLALERRMRLIPYLYTLFHEAHTTGMPVVRPLFFADPTDPALRAADDAFLLGNDLLVRASVQPDGRRRSPTPRGHWRPFEIAQPGHPELPELSLRAGAILPVGPVMQHVDELPLDPLTLLVSLDERGHAAGRLYEDAGDGHEHEQGDYLLTTYRARADGPHITVDIAGREGHREPPDRAVEVVVLLPDGSERTATARDGEPVTITL